MTFDGTQGHPIFCDEGGFTGNHLLDERQPYYAYAAVAITHQEAANLSQTIKKEYRFQGDELKASNLLKYNKGRHAVLDILSAIASRTKVVVHDKKFALACNIFEYTFEPCLSEINSVFYANNFHKFIATLLYINFVSTDASAQLLFERFQELIKPGNHALVGSLVKEPEASGLILFDDQSVFDQILLFIELNKDYIAQELKFHTDDNPIYKWILDLTQTSLYSLLIHHGDVHSQMTVYCDSSKPLIQNQVLFDKMINRTDQAKSYFFGVERSMLFNLDRPLQLVDSKEYPGIQLADVLCGAALHCFNNKNSDFASKFFKILYENGTFLNESILPDLIHVDLERHETNVNCVILLELVKRSMNKVSLIHNMSEFYDTVKRAALHQPLPLGSRLIT